MDAEDTEIFLELLKRIAISLEILSGEKCDDCERIHPDEAYQYVLDNPPERGP